jgi:hypothetical protein
MSGAHIAREGRAWSRGMDLVALECEPPLEPKMCGSINHSFIHTVSFVLQGALLYLYSLHYPYNCLSWSEFIIMHLRQLQACCHYSHCTTFGSLASHCLLLDCVVVWSGKFLFRKLFDVPPARLTPLTAASESSLASPSPPLPPSEAAWGSWTPPPWPAADAPPDGVGVAAHAPPAFAGATADVPPPLSIASCASRASVAPSSSLPSLRRGTVPRAQWTHV